MSSPVVPGPPNLTTLQGRQIAAELYGLSAGVQGLPSERDQNFLLDTPTGRFVLKVSNPGETVQSLEFQNQALAILAQAGEKLIPRVLPTLQGTSVGRWEEEGLLVRLVTHLSGRVLAAARPHSPELLEDLGRLLGRVDRALLGFEHPWSRRDLKWDLGRAEWISNYLHLLSGPRRQVVERILDEYRNRVRPALRNLRWSIIHNDANDHNVLVESRGLAGQRISGLIDFGDMIFSPLVCELAVACAYAMFDKADPIGAAVSLVGGYHRHLPLRESELAVLLELVQTRLAVSVVNSAWQRQLYPDNQYLQVSDGPAWDLLDNLCALPPGLGLCRLRQICGLEPCGTSLAVVDWLKRKPDQLGPVVEPELSRKPLWLDLSVGSLELGNVPDFTDAAAFSARLFDRIRRNGATIGVGRYNEARPLYATPIFDAVDRVDRRSIHLGIDLFLPRGTPVLAPLEGRVHSFRDNSNALDYGPTVILEHDIGPGLVFHTLFGHLTRDSLGELRGGAVIAKGATVGRIGGIEENGGWPPHLHFQIVCDPLGCRGDFPGVAAPSQRGTWLSLSPDPNVILRIPESTPLGGGLEPAEIIRIRERHMGKSLSVSYRRPLKIVRGFMQHLYCHEGQRYLDAVNNVAHVGHCHPRVVAAAAGQMATLNTNTRYLHDNLARYAERLCGLFPDPLNVCFLVCSGSEANELALRMARTYSGREDIIVLEGAYHGNTRALIEASPYKFAGPGGFGLPEHTHVAPMPDVYRGVHRRGDAGPLYAAEIGVLIDRMGEAGRTPAAFLYESILGCGGQIVLPAGYLEEAHRLVRKSGGVCIADEVQVGFGRVGTHRWGFELHGVVPDIVTLGKPIGNGHPMGAVITTPKIADAFANGMEYFNTFGGNPVSCAVGLAVLDVLEEEGLQANALEVGGCLRHGLLALKEKYPLIGDVRGSGLFLGVELVAHNPNRAPAAPQTGYLVERMRDRGILVSVDGPLHNVVKIKPPLVWTKGDAQELLGELEEILCEDYLTEPDRRFWSDP